MQRYYNVFFCTIFCILLLFPQSVKVAKSSTLPFQITFEYSFNKEVSPTNLIIRALIKIDNMYYAYAHSEKDALPTTLVLQNELGEPIESQIYYPQGEPHEDILNEGETIGVYTDEFPIFIQTSKEVLEKKVAVDVSLLLCSAKHCIPINKQIPINIPTDIPSLSDVSWEEEYWLYNNAAIQTQPKDTAGFANSDGSSNYSNVFVPHYFQEEFEPTKIEFALLLGFLAGLILNIMPCVLPVLTLKFSFILSHINKKDEKEYFKTVRIQNILFSLGIISWFLFLAVGLDLLELAWGSFFQSVPIVFGLILIVFILALSLFNVFTLPVIDLKVNTNSHPYIQAYFTGFMTTLLATPCSGPLLGGALGWAVLQPVYIVYIVFLAISLGMSLPYILFAIYPKALYFLPKPGVWCNKLEQLVGFFLLGTTIYLVSILPNHMFFETLVTLLVTAIAVWCWGAWGGLAASKIQKSIVGFFIICAIFLSSWWSFQPPVNADWQTYTKEGFQKILGTQPILLEFTADWCPTCKFLEKTVLTPSFLEYLVEEYNIVPIRVDLTLSNPDAEALLRALGSISIPVIAIFSSGQNVNQPLVLRDLYTSEQLEQALRVLVEKE